MSVIVGCRATELWPNDLSTSTNSLLRRCKPPKASVMNTGCWSVSASSCKRDERERAERERERPIKKGGGAADEVGGASVLHADACAQRVAVWPLTEKGPPDDALPGAIDGVAMRWWTAASESA